MGNWFADRIERLPVKALVPYIKNARKHSENQVDQLAASIREWGFPMPILVDEDNEIIAGHGRLQAAERLGMESVPVMVARGWTKRQVKAYRLADNQLALNAAWDVKLLAAELGELTGMESLIGFGDDELRRLAAGVGNPGLTDPDETPEKPETPVSRAGDLWELGGHRILCGDATKTDDVAWLLGQVKPNLMVTDPPYGVEYDAKWRDGVDLNLGKKLGQNGSGRAIGKVPNDDRADWREAWILYPGDIIYVWHGGLHTAVVADSLEKSGFQIRSQIIWVKQHFVLSRGDYHWQHEPCWYGVRRGKKGRWEGDRSQTSVWSIPNNNPLGGGHEQKFGHSTQKPVECMRRPIVNNSSPGQAVYDPFVGSGTTVIACEMEARQALAIDIDPGYVDVAVNRWQAFTGEEATLAGVPFAAVAEQRKTG